MSNRTSVVVLASALVLGFSAIVPAHGADNILHTNYLTFSGPVSLPGVTLRAGTYAFERAVATNPDVIVVRDRDRSRVYFLGFTRRVARPANLPHDVMVTIGEAGRDIAPAVTAWYPVGESIGHRFIYGTQ